MTNLNGDNVVEELVKQVPELSSIYKGEMDYYGEISNYVFFGPLLSKFIVEHHTRAGAELTNGNVLNGISAYIEKCVETDDPDIRDLILSGFLESFVGTLQDYPALKKLLRAKTTELLTLFK